MRRTYELTMRGERPDLELLLARVEARLSDGWQRDRAAEERRSRHAALGRDSYCFTCTAKPDRPAAGFWIYPRSANELYVSHVIPLENRKLGEDDQERLLTEFEREFLRPVAAEVGVATEVVEHRLTLEHDLSPEAARLLRTFAASANRTCLDRKDRQRWNAFLVRVHQDESLIGASALEEWLRDEGWPEDTRRQLVGEHEAARSLLLAYDEEVQRH